jgi:hypothetical protein
MTEVLVVVGNGRTIHRATSRSTPLPVCGIHQPRHVTELRNRPVRLASDDQVRGWPRCLKCFGTTHPRARVDQEAQRRADEEVAHLFASLPPLTREELDVLGRALTLRSAVLAGAQTPTAEAMEEYRTLRSLATAVAEARYTLGR